MAVTESPKCPVCGTPMVPSKMDGAFKFNGTVRFDGLMCPKCSQDAPAEKPAAKLDGSFKLDGSTTLGG